MSFLLLKSKSKSKPRSNRLTTTSYRRSNGNHYNNNGVVSSDRNPAVASRSHNSHSNGHNSNSCASSSSSSSNRFVNTGGGQVQLHRPQRQQKRQVNKQDQPAKQQQSQKQHGASDVISMDEVMEDLRILEQQQRDSQHLLASIKLTKQHKLEQRVSLETKLSSLKYSNGESRAQLFRARDVMSKSTRELGTAKIHSERSSENLKKFDDKLKRTLSHVRGLQVKHRQVEQAIAKLHNADTMLSQQQRMMAEKLKSKEMERDDVTHRQKLMFKSIQSCKLKTQTLVGDTMKMRSELSELEADLTIAQQMESSTKFRVDSLDAEIHAEEKRYGEVKHTIEVRIEAAKEKKIELEQKITNSEVTIETKTNRLSQAFQECLQFQKEDGLELSTSPKTAAIDIERIRGVLTEEELNLGAMKQEETILLDGVKCLEDELLVLQEKNAMIKDYTEKLSNTANLEKQKEELRVNERQNFFIEFEKEQMEVDKLRITAAQFKEEHSIDREVSMKEENEQDLIINELKDKIQTIENDIVSFDKDFESRKLNMDEQRLLNKNRIDEAKKHVADIKTEFDHVQKEADKLAKIDSDTEKEITEIVESGEIELKSIERERTTLLDEFPCMASLDFAYDESRSDKDQIETALSDLRCACETRIDSAQNEKKRRIEQAKIKAEKEERDRLAREVEKRARIELEKQEKILEEERIKAMEKEQARLAEKAEAEERDRIGREKQEQRIQEERQAKLDREAKECARKEREKREKILEEERIKTMKEEQDKLAREAEERAHAQAMAKERARKKAEAEERAQFEREEQEKRLEEERNRAIQEEQDRLTREAEDHARVQAMAKERARKKRREEERVKNQNLVKEKAKKKVEAIERAKNKALVEEKARKRAEMKKEAKEKVRKRVVEEERKKAQAKVKAREESKAKLRAETQKAKADVENERMIHGSRRDSRQKSTSLSSTSERTRKRRIRRLDQESSTCKSIEKKKRISSLEKKECAQDPNCKSTGVASKSGLFKEMKQTKTGEKRKRSKSIEPIDSSISEKQVSSQVKNDKRQSDNKTTSGNRPSVQKLDIFTSHDHMSSKKTKSTSAMQYSTSRKIASTTQDSKSIHDRSKRQKTQKSKVPSQSETTTVSRKSLSSLRRRKRTTGTVGKSKTSMSGSNDMDFSFM